MTVHETLMTGKGWFIMANSIGTDIPNRACTKTVSATIAIKKFKLILSEEEQQMTKDCANLVTQCIALTMVLRAEFKISRHTYTNWKKD